MSIYPTISKMWGFCRTESGFFNKYIWVKEKAQTVKNLPAVLQTWVWSLGGKDPLEKGMSTHSGTLAWRVPWTEEPGGLQRMGPQMAGHDRAGTHVHAQGCVRA